MLFVCEMKTTCDNEIPYKKVKAITSVYDVSTRNIIHINIRNMLVETLFKTK